MKPTTTPTAISVACSTIENARASAAPTPYEAVRGTTAAAWNTTRLPGRMGNDCARVMVTSRRPAPPQPT